MNIRNLAFRRNFDTNNKPTTIELILETDDRRMFSYHIRLPLNLKEFPKELFDAATAIQSLLEHGEEK